MRSRRARDVWPPAALLAARLRNQWLARDAPADPAAVVARLCAVQAQDFISAKWAIGLRGAGLDDAAVAAAFDRGDLLRTHVLRPTWHFVTPADIRWMLALTAPRVHQASKFYYAQHGLDAKTLARAHAVLAAELAGRRFRTRAELAAALAARGIDARGPRLGLLTIHAEQEQVMCSGPVRGKQLTYALFDERAPRARARTPRDPGAELAARYFSSHGPATLRDYVWWSGLTVAQARKGLAHAALEPRDIGGLTYWATSWDAAPRMAAPAAFLLPNFDEYVIAYKDRGLVQPRGEASGGIRPGVDTFAHPLIVDGLLAGFWRRRVTGPTTCVEIVVQVALAAKQRRAVRNAAERLRAFCGEQLVVSGPP